MTIEIEETAGRQMDVQRRPDEIVSNKV